MTVHVPRDSLTCESTRAASLRECLIRDLLRLNAITMQAVGALLDDDDAAAIEHLQRHRIVMRASIAPMVEELAGRP